MAGGLSLYQEGASLLHRAHPLTKGVLTLSALALAFIAPSLYWILGIALMLLILVIVAGVLRRLIAVALALLLPITVLLLAVQGFANPANHTVLLRRDRTELPIDDSGAPIRDSLGEVRGVVLVFRDFTEQKKAERLVRDSERRFRSAFEQAAVGMTEVAPDGRFIRVNDKLCEITGYSREELLSRTFMQIPVERLWPPYT